MKLRCVHNHIRLRLRKSELRQLAEKGQVSESVSFPGGQGLTFALKTEIELTEIQAQFEQGEIAVLIPMSMSKTWIQSNQVGIEKVLALPDQQQLHLLIEKDFPCNDREDEDKNDTFWELANQKADSC